MAEDEDGSRLCLVCTAKSDSAHFGIDSCRACAAFFRRTVTLKKTYICRQGTQSCDVHKDVRFICRKCRYEKCRAVGMHPDNVHSKLKRPNQEDSPGGEKPEKRVAEPLFETGSSWPQPSSNHSHSEMEVKCEPGPSNENGSPIGLGSSFKAPAYASTLMSSGDMTLLWRIHEQYRVTCLMRRSAEHTATVLTSGSSKGMFDQTIECQDIVTRPATWASLNLITKSGLPGAAEFANNCFEEFAGLEELEKWSLIRNYILCACFIFEGFYRSRKMFPDRQNIFMCSYTTFVDMDHVEDFLVDAEGLPEKKNAARVLHSTFMDGMFSAMGPCIERADITETEFVAIIGLIFWPAYMPKSTPRVSRIANDIHQRIFHELHIFYKEHLRLDDYSSRLGHITEILLCVQGVANRMKEDMEIYRLLNIFDEDNILYNIMPR